MRPRQLGRASDRAIGGIPRDEYKGVSEKEQAAIRIASSFLLLLLIADCAFVLLHILWKATPILDSPYHSLERDRGYSELYQYIKELWIILLLLSVRASTRATGYFAWALVFLYVLLDDAVQVHEELGAVVAEKLGFDAMLGLRAIDFGELTVSAFSGAVLLTLLAWLYVRGPGPFRQATRHLLLLLLALAFFGVFVNMVHVAFGAGEPRTRLWPSWKMAARWS